MGTPWTRRSRLIRLRRRSRPANAVLTLLEEMRHHRVTQNATLIGHYGFLSIFPLMLALTTVLGFVLQGNEKLRNDIVDSAAKQIPIIGRELTTNPDGLKGNAVVLTLGLLTTLWAGTKAFLAMQNALDDVNEVPLDNRDNIAEGRLRALIGVCLIGGSQLAIAGLSGLVAVGGVTMAGKLLLIVAAVVLNTGVLLGTFRWLSSRPMPWARLWPGAIFAGVGFALLQVLGTTLVGRAISRASPVYGTFATVIALLSWLTLHAVIALVGAEINRLPDRMPEDLLADPNAAAAA